MEYAFLIFSNDTSLERLSPAERVAMHEGHGELVAKLSAAGVKWEGRQLNKPTTATTIRSTDGIDRVTVDGPYAETKEHLGGYYVVEADDLDAALAWARLIPIPNGMSVEVRPVVQM